MNQQTAFGIDKPLVEATGEHPFGFDKANSLLKSA